MSKKTQYTVITPLSVGISRETVLSTLHDHLDMIDLNPTHEERHITKPPREATPEEYHCQWYEITDKISYLPGIKGKVSFKACFHDLTNGVQIHVYAPAGLDIKEKWTLGGNLPGKAVQPPEIGIGAPVSGLYLREDVEIKCNFLMTKFVKNQLKDALATLVARLMVKANLQEALAANNRLAQGAHDDQYAPQPGISELSSPQSHYSSPPASPPTFPGMPLSPPISPNQSMSLMSQNHRPEWAQGAPSPGLEYKRPNRSSSASLPPIPNYNPARYSHAPANGAMEMSADSHYAQQHQQWQNQQQSQHGHGPPHGYAELQ
ncbi:hypothetical protein BJ878DRAFT_180453 [Calycina marina]|uniref:DUF7053 domain-containing protein n=1 Tax=Calycina marina TaxID=1763456 RepID=A0A9P7YZU9_9HELO|nr:hypothetical protein BJ878DRAFT_180453 [Calycina marina]